MVFYDCVSGCFYVQLDGVDGVVVVRDYVVYVVWVGVGVDYGDYWNIQFVGFLNGDVFMIYVYYEQGVWQIIYVFDVVDGVFQFFYFMLVYQVFFFGQFVEGVVLFLGFQVMQMFDGLMNGFLVGEYVVQLMVIYIWYVVMFGFFMDCVLSGMFGVYEQDFVVVGCQFVQE